MSQPDRVASAGVVLPWDSRFFGFRVGRATGRRLTLESLRALLAWSEAERLRCLYFSADADCGDTLSLAHAGGFRFVDMRVELAVEPGGSTAEAPLSGLRPATIAELPWLEALSRRAYPDTRFFKDDAFPRDRVADLYAEWIRRDFREHQIFVVPERAGIRPAGYVTCEVDAPRQVGRIGLIAVSEEERGRGHGRTLVRGALRWFAGAGCREARVVTQASNVEAQRLYQGAGFRTAEVSAIFHRWF